MRTRRRTRSSSVSVDVMELRTLPATLIALIDTGIDLSIALGDPRFDFTWGYDAFGRRTVAEYGPEVVQDTSLQHGHGASVADFIVRGVSDAWTSRNAPAPDVRILPIRATSSGSRIDANAVIRGVYWAADHGAAVINLSLNFFNDPILTDPQDPLHGVSLSRAIQYADKRGAVVVTAPGNAALDIDRLVVFPPYADHPVYSDARPLPTNLLVAAAVDSEGRLTRVSNWGAEQVDLGAYTSPEGATSYAAGYTSGVVGVVRELLVSSQTPRDVIELIKETAIPREQAVGRWSRTNAVINPTGAVARALASGQWIDAGGPGGESFVADTSFLGGTIYTASSEIDTSAVFHPAPASIYQTERYGEFTYTIRDLTPEEPYLVRLDFAEVYWDAPRQRLFNVLINGNPVLTNFDIYGVAGGKNKALAREFLVAADRTGQITLDFRALKDHAKVSGIRVTRATDLAAGRPAFASSVEHTGYAPQLAVDGDASTRWSSGQWMQSGPIGWFAVDLGAPFQIGRVRLDWETAHAVDYQIQVSDDAVHWTAIATVSGNPRPGAADFRGLDAVGRFVRVFCTKTSAGCNNYSLYDVQVFGRKVMDLARGRRVFASSSESSEFTPRMAIDGDASTRWSSGQWMREGPIGWLAVDLGAPFQIGRVRLDWETAYAVDYQIQVSNDAAHWTAIAAVSGNLRPGVADFPGLDAVGRFVRIYCTKTSSGSNNYSLYDVMIMGQPAEFAIEGQAEIMSPTRPPSFNSVSPSSSSLGTTVWLAGPALPEIGELEDREPVIGSAAGSRRTWRSGSTIKVGGATRTNRAEGANRPTIGLRQAQSQMEAASRFGSLSTHRVGSSSGTRRWVKAAVGRFDERARFGPPSPHQLSEQGDCDPAAGRFGTAHRELGCRQGEIHDGLTEPNLP